MGRLELIRTLRELGLGLGLEDVHRVPAGERTVAEVAATHVAAPDAQIRSLKVTRAVLSSAARRGSSAEEMTRTMIEYNTADRRPDIPAGASAMFFRRLIEPDGGARERGVAPGSPEADSVLTELLGEGTDRAAVLRRIDRGNEGARYRELAAVIKGEAEPPKYHEEFAWVVAALHARPGR